MALKASNFDTNHATGSLWGRDLSDKGKMLLDRDKTGTVLHLVRWFSCCLMMLFSSPLSQAQGTIDNLAKQQEKSRQELLTLQNEITLSKVRKKELNAEISALEADRETINRNLIETSSTSRSLEERIERNANRLEELRGEEDGVRQSLRERRGTLIEVIAALQRMGHKPPPALLVTPEDALASVRSAILLGAVVPEVRAETELLATELNELVRIRTDIDRNRKKLVADLQALAEEEERLGLLLDQKKQLSNAAKTELAEQTARAAELAGKANNLSNLLSSLENEIAAVRQAAEAARRAEEERRKAEEQRIAEAREEPSPDFANAARISPAMAFTKAKGLLPKPVSGVELIAFDQKTAEGDISRGLSIATRSGSRVVSPSDGWVMYAGPFRSYGQLLIINAGDGYHVVLAGMERINVELGQFVLVGEPIGIMGERRFAGNSTGNVNVDVGSLRPVLYVEFRKDGNSIDPSPWWVTSQFEERNG